MSDLYPRPPADEEEREAVHYMLARRVCEARSDGVDGWICNRAPRHAGKHVAAGTLEIGGPILVLATWPQTPDHSGDATEMLEPVAVRAGAVVRTSTGIFVPEPCPFDGGKGEVTTARVEGDPADQTSYTVQCVSCAAVGPWHGTEEGARAGWAKRAAPAGTMPDAVEALVEEAKRRNVRPCRYPENPCGPTTTPRHMCAECIADRLAAALASQTRDLAGVRRALDDGGRAAHAYQTIRVLRLVAEYRERRESHEEEIERLRARLAEVEGERDEAEARAAGWHDRVTAQAMELAATEAARRDAVAERDAASARAALQEKAVGLVTEATRRQIAAMQAAGDAVKRCGTCGANPANVPAVELPIVRGALDAQEDAERRLFAATARAVAAEERAERAEAARTAMQTAALNVAAALNGLRPLPQILDGIAAGLIERVRLLAVSRG